jgi:hypothetical protein
MKKLVYIGLLVGLYSCGPRMYSYKFSMDESKKSDQMYYENDTIAVDFHIHSKGIWMDLVNKTDSAIHVDWNKMQMLVNEKDMAIRHISYNHGKYQVYDPPAVIPAKGRIADLIVYARQVSYTKKRGTETLTIAEMYPTNGDYMHGQVQHLKGQKIRLQFPVSVNDIAQTKSFSFVLKDIKSRATGGGSAGAEIVGHILLLPFYLLTF